MNRTIGKWTKPKAYSVRQSMFIAMLEQAILMSAELLQESVTLVLPFSLSNTSSARSISLAIVFPLVSSRNLERLRLLPPPLPLSLGVFSWNMQ